MYSIHQLRTFLAVARVGSVREAAEELVVSQPAVSSALAALERTLGVALFE
ncbi:MAG: helix-turn-helix domain-containing protein, partial [Vulcanimicrobiaceae bacterium]